MFIYGYVYLWEGPMNMVFNLNVCKNPVVQFIGFKLFSLLGFLSSCGVDERKFTRVCYNFVSVRDDSDVTIVNSVYSEPGGTILFGSRFQSSL